MKIEFIRPGATSGATLAVGVFAGGQPINPDLRGDILATANQLVDRGAFEGRMGQSFNCFNQAGAEHVLIIGVGARDHWNERAAELFAAHAVKAASIAGARSADIDLGSAPAAIAAHSALGARLAAYRFDRHRTRPAPNHVGALEAVRIVTANPEEALRVFEPLSTLADAICFTRDLVNEPANLLYPREFAQRLTSMKQLGVEVEILGEREMGDLGMGALLGVGQGSARESQLAILQWRGDGDPSAAPIAFVGKGVCFDTGGISLKAADRMEEMIIDMSGAAAVAGTIQALAARKARVNAVGILGLVENMPDGKAQRPGDIVTTFSGQTVEIINTDAEGRLVLADALWYCRERFKPASMIDLATLTGVIMSALGDDIGGLFSNNEILASQLIAASTTTEERLWRLPMPADYAKALESRAADLKNVGDRFGGAIAAAQFLQRFVGETPWAHIDMGLTVWKQKSASPLYPDGAVGWGVRLLDQLVADHFEKAEAGG